MEESNPNTNESKPQKINIAVFAINISVVIILCLCVLVYFIFDKNTSISNSVCINSDNLNLLPLAFFGFLFFPEFIAFIMPKEYELKETKWWIIHKFISSVVLTLYIPVNIFYLIICE